MVVCESACRHRRGVQFQRYRPSEKEVNMDDFSVSKTSKVYQLFTSSKIVVYFVMITIC